MKKPSKEALYSQSL